MWKFLVPVILAVVVFVEEVVTSREEASSSCSYSTTKKAQDYSHKSLIFCWTWKVCVWENSQSVRKWALINQPWQSQPPGNGCSSINSNGGGLDACPLALLALKMGRRWQRKRPSCCVAFGLCLMGKSFVDDPLLLIGWCWQEHRCA